MTRNLISIPPALDLNKRHFDATINGIRIIGTWFREGRNRSQPCLVLLDPRYTLRRGHRPPPVVIKLDDAWRWAMHGDVGDPAHCVAQVCEWMHNGILPGNPANKLAYMAIIDAINQRLPDLIAMPPLPVEQGLIWGDLTATNRNTGETIEKEVRFDG